MSGQYGDARPNSVNTALTRNRRSWPRVEHDDYAAYVRRIAAGTSSAHAISSRRPPKLTGLPTPLPRVCVGSDSRGQR
ncbi:MAG: hypothetical protein JWR06_2529 [Jatrophihabitans sp.]|nr:hypothetical protein [Jatrophihabitans sp.]MDT4903199.1 hypothetical protein [Pseudonocardiales bacterium]MCW2658336.1 hypothetical protein [Jatrophihabitans sp.]MDT4930101.1 hypothetical protein [Pseudonocardiales bacterium]MDT4949660.1 hypothetical protein [Pseudonocardiales bacterium]